MERRQYAIQTLKYILKVYQNHTCFRREKAILVHNVIPDFSPSSFIHEQDSNPYYISELLLIYPVNICPLASFFIKFIGKKMALCWRGFLLNSSVSQLSSKKRAWANAIKDFIRGNNSAGTWLFRTYYFVAVSPKLPSFHEHASRHELDPAFVFYPLCFSQLWGLNFFPSASFPCGLCVSAFSSQVLSSIPSSFHTDYPLFSTCLTVFLLARTKITSGSFSKILVTIYPALDGPLWWKAKANMDIWGPQPSSLTFSGWILSLGALWKTC